MLKLGKESSTQCGCSEGFSDLKMFNNETEGEIPQDITLSRSSVQISMFCCINITRDFWINRMNELKQTGVKETSISSTPSVAQL